MSATVASKRETDHDHLIARIMHHYRSRRMGDFERIFNLSDRHTIIDIGGRAALWSYISKEPSITLLNPEPPSRTWNAERASSKMDAVQGDGRDIPFPDKTFDIAHSNSVIEHVGSWVDQQAFAREVRRVGKGYYVQTPNRHFPIEPHVLAPFVQYLPRKLAKWVVQHATPHALRQKPTADWAARFVESTRLLTVGEMRKLFPDAVIVREKAFGLTKSIIAYRR